MRRMPLPPVEQKLEAPELAERERELAALESALTEAATGHGGLAVVTGEAGAGKTVLLQEFCARRPPDVRVLWGMCDALLTPQPLGPLHDIATERATPCAISFAATRCHTPWPRRSSTSCAGAGRRLS